MPPDISPMAGAILRRYRRALGLTQAELGLALEAYGLGVTDRGLRNYESGARAVPPAMAGAVRQIAADAAVSVHE